MENAIENIYFGKTVLVTGHTGFKGSWLCLWLIKMGAKVVGYSIDVPTEPAHFKLLNLEMKSVIGDILDMQNLQKCVNENQPEIIFHLAAQSLVRESYRDPFKTYTTNVIGTLNIFEVARNCNSVKAIINVTTDKVYENIEQDVAYKEADRLGGYDIYSSSKACSEFLSSSYRNSFLNKANYGQSHQILLATARAGNVIGGGDWAADRLIPDVIKASIKKEKVIIRNLASVRPWQHVLEPISGYLMLGQKLLLGHVDYADAWNFGPDYDQCITVESLLNLLQKKWEQIIWEYKPNAHNIHEANLLKLDSAKSAQYLNWRSVLGIDATLEMTINWYRNYYEQNLLNSIKDIDNYLMAMRSHNILI
jgi:CDP-glucose 4,6-dehydratase